MVTALMHLMAQAEHTEWEDTENSDEGTQTAKSVHPRKPPARRAIPSSSFSSMKPPRGQRPSPRDRPQVPRDRPQVERPSNYLDRWNDAAFSAFVFSITYVFELLRVALVWLRKPLSLILVGYALVMMASHLQHKFISTLRSTFDPLCFLPGISRMAICSWHDSGDLSPAGLRPRGAPKHADYPSLVNIQTVTFDRLLDESVGGAHLALEIKKAEMATSDLTTLVRVSSLTSKEKIAATLDKFVEDARRTARGLQRFSAKVGGAVDGIVAVNEYALQQIEPAAPASWLLNRWPSIWNPFSHFTSLAAVTASFTQAMGVLEFELHTLILAAEASLHDLDVLEEQLRILHAIVSRENVSLSTSQQEMLSRLWTLLGGNRAELHRFETNLNLLSGLAGYRQQALAHVVGALHTLQKMSAELEELRERLSRPVMLGDTIPLEVHVKGIRGGLERLMEGRLKAKKLEDARYAKLLAPLEK